MMWWCDVCATEHRGPCPNGGNKIRSSRLIGSGTSFLKKPATAPIAGSSPAWSTYWSRFEVHTFDGVRIVVTAAGSGEDA